MNDIFCCGEGYAQYNEEQIRFLRNININNLGRKSKIGAEISEELVENISKEPEEDGEYILGLA